MKVDPASIDVAGDPPGADAVPCAIQPSGFLLALSDDWQVEAVSANVSHFLGLEPERLIGGCSSAFLADAAIHALRNRLALLRDPEGIERLFAFPLTGDGQLHDVAIHVAGDQVIVEAEPCSAKTYGDVTGTLRGMMGRLDGASGLADFCTAGARQVRALTGFDRVFVNRLDPDGGGTVIAESARASGANLVGSRIPPTAFAAYERAAYRCSPLHAIADVEAEAVAIVAVRNDAMPDLSHAILRVPSSGQLEQVRAMLAHAAMSIALHVGGELWGVISCHHHAPRHTSFERRALVELFAQMLGLRIEILELKAARLPA